MPLKYYGDQLSSNIIKRPNGGIICKNVPIGRTGDMYYLGRELGLGEGRENERIRVVRDAKDVFDEATLASFEGAAVTDDHPPEDVTSTNFAMYAKGHVQNVRRGTGRHADKIVADLFIDDEILAQKVLNKVKREVSSGYGCRYQVDQATGTFLQKQMRGNHVAVVPTGRAGHSVSIQDSKPVDLSQAERRKPLMNKQTDKLISVINLALRSARDANTTDEIEAIARDTARVIDEAVVTPVSDPKYVASAESGAKPGQVEAVAGKSYDTGFETEVRDALAGFRATLDAMSEKMKERAEGRAEEREEEKRREEDKKASDADGTKIVEEAAATKAEALDEMVAKLTGDKKPDEDKGKDEDASKQEEAKTVKAESMDAATGFAGIPTSKDTMAALLVSMKPTIAAIKDPNDRKRVIDALMSQAETVASAQDNQYAGVLNNAQQSASAFDASAIDAFEDQQNAYDKRNPHVMAKKGDVQ